MSDPRFPIGWVDALAAAVKTGDEKTRAEALGLEPRRCFRRSQSDIAASRARGAARGRPKRPLPETDDEF